MRDDEAMRLISGVYETVGDAERWPDAIDAFRRALHADAAIQFSSDIESGTIERTRTTHRRTIIGIAPATAELHARHAHESPLAAFIPHLPTGTREDQTPSCR